MYVKYLMTKDDLLTVSPTSPVLDAVEILVQKRFNGVPVIDKKGVLKGMITQHDMMLRGTDLHLPTIIRLFEDVGTYNKDRKFLSEQMRGVADIRVKAIMNSDPMTLLPDVPVEEALKIFAENHDVNPIAVTDDAGVLLGVLSRYDMIKLFGGRGVHIEKENISAPERLIDKELRQTLPKFEEKFLFVSRMRVTLWLLISACCGLVGFASAFLLMLRFVGN